MKKVIIAPDSFKGTLSSTEVCDITERVIKEFYPECEVQKLPMADGGEGTTDVYLSIFGGKKIFCTVKSPLMKDIEASFAILSGSTAVIETAAASGITIEKANNPYLATTYGTGQLVKKALDCGVRKIILGLGGSATTDGGAGFLRALGARFYGEDGNEIGFGGLENINIKRIDLGGLDERLKETEFDVLCDVKNPLCGKDGAAHVFSPQKGADENGVKSLDEALKNYAEVSAKLLKKDFSSFPGAGAAGGMGFMCMAYLNSTLKSGANCILDEADFDKKAKDADLIITGEGKMDSQSFMGKVPFAVAKRSGKTKVIAFVGVLETDRAEAARHGIDEVMETNENHLPFEKIKGSAARDLEAAVRKYFKEYADKR